MFTVTKVAIISLIFCFTGFTSTTDGANQIADSSEIRLILNHSYRDIPLLAVKRIASILNDQIIPQELPSKEETGTDPARQFQVSIHPNPTIDQVHFDFRLKKEEQVSLRIRNILGVEVISYQDKKSTGQHRISVDLSQHNTGLYIYNLTIGDISSTGRVIKKEQD